MRIIFNFWILNIYLFFKRFPALAIPNKMNKEEIQLDLDSPKKEEESKAIERPKDKKEKEKEKEREKDKEKEKDKTKEKGKERESSKEKTHKKSKRHRKSDSNSRSRSRSKSKHRQRKRSSSSSLQESFKKPKKIAFKEAEVGRIYDGRVTKVHDYGCFVLLENFVPKKEGLVHISNIRDKRITNAFEAVQRNQTVKVKVIAIAGSKISLSMKEVDQETGEEIQKRAKNKQNNVTIYL